MRRSPPIAEHRLLSDGRSHALLRPTTEIDGHDEFEAGESPFVPASWWAITALALLGRAEALPRADALCALLPSLQSEQFDLVRNESLGNVPLVRAHAECARALYHLDAGIRRRARARALLRRARHAI